MINIWDRICDLTDMWFLKTCFSAVFGALIYILGIKHVQVFLVFSLMVFMDLFTKWASLAYQMLIKDGADGKKLSLVDKYWAIPIAFDRHIISSEYMRRGFCDKVVTYVAATAVSFLFDYMASGFTGKTNFAVNLTWLYLGSAEFLSILENLRDGGNIRIGKFLELARTKIENKVRL